MGLSTVHSRPCRPPPAPFRDALRSSRDPWRDSIAWAAAALVTLVLGNLVLDSVAIGPLTRHMGEHLVLMNAVAPLTALAIVAAGRKTSALASGYSLVGASVTQLSLLWGWHAPAAFAAALHAPLLHALMQASLLAAALWFWLAVLADKSAFRWRGLFALLTTGKLFCLLGVLLVFAPRLLYGDLVFMHGSHALQGLEALADQHLGGLMMLVVCPLTYVLAGVVIAAHWLRDLARANAVQEQQAADKLNIMTT